MEPTFADFGLFGPFYGRSFSSIGALVRSIKGMFFAY